MMPFTFQDGGQEGTMNSLKKLANIYGEDDEEGDESSATVSNTPTSKRRRESDKDEIGITDEKTSKIKLEIPMGVLDMFKEYGSESSTTASGQHQGRTRGFEHFPGNWATHVLVPFEIPDWFPEFLSSLQEIWPDQSSELNTCDMHDFHVSISRTVPIRHHWIEPLKTLLQRGFQGKRKFVCDFPKVSVYVNDEKTRTFIALDVAVGVLQLKELVQVVDKAFQEFGLPRYYDEPSFHASIAWSLGDISEKLSASTLTKMQRILDSYSEEHSSLVLTANEIRCQTGNKVFHFPIE